MRARDSRAPHASAHLPGPGRLRTPVHRPSGTGRGVRGARRAHQRSRGARLSCRHASHGLHRLVLCRDVPGRASRRLGVRLRLGRARAHDGIHGRLAGHAGLPAHSFRRLPLFGYRAARARAFGAGLGVHADRVRRHHCLEPGGSGDRGTSGVRGAGCRNRSAGALHRVRARGAGERWPGTTVGFGAHRSGPVRLVAGRRRRVDCRALVPRLRRHCRVRRRERG